MRVQCSECGAVVSDAESCHSNFHALLYRESEVGQLIPDFFSSLVGQTAHFFAISCYAIQHPRSMGYTVEALLAARENVAVHLTGKASIAKIRTTVRNATDGKVRVLRRDGAPVHDWGVQNWPVTVEDVLAAPLQGYGDATTLWAQATLDAITNTEQLRLLTSRVRRE